MKKIYFKDAEHCLTLEDLIAELFSCNGYAVETFKNEELTFTDCKSESRRSFEDLMCIANTYFENTSEEDLMKVIHDIGLKYYYCSDINKIVFHFNGNDLVGKEFLNYIKYTYNDEYYIYAPGTYKPRKLYKIYKNVFEKKQEITL